MSPRARDNLTYPKISSDEPLATFNDIHGGGTVSTRALHKVGYCLKNNSETHVMSRAESTVKPEIARRLTIPGIRIRREEKERQPNGFF